MYIYFLSLSSLKKKKKKIIIMTNYFNLHFYYLRLDILLVYFVSFLNLSGDAFVVLKLG